MEGVQFHPESVATEHGHRIVANFLRMKGGEWGPSGPAGTGFPAKSTTSSSSSSAAAAAGSAATNTAPSLLLEHADLVAMAKASGLKEGPEAARELAEAHAVAAAAATVAATGGASVPMES